ncbi:MAG TPA: HAD-IC family P-type ATPase, partial [Bacillota bacterium]|nr:HAD-IC family P-type ATPase [Bacillota bacterium]
MNYYLKSKDEVFTQLETGAGGLSSSEAESRLILNGKNKLVEGKKTSLLKRFVKQLADPMIIVLLAAAILSAITAIYEHESPTDVIIILVVVLINSILGVVQETKAEEAIEALKSMTASTTKVLRDGKLLIMKSEDLVPGDIIHLDAGDAVPADARIIECASMKVEEAALTGESVPVEKTSDTLTAKNGDIALGDRRNMVYMGSTVVYGRGVAVVT